MKKLLITLVAVNVILLLAGCGTIPQIDVGTIPIKSMGLRDNVDAKALKKRIEQSRKSRGRVQVVLVDFDHGNIKAARVSNAGNDALNELKQVVTNAGGELLDRGLVKKLKKEIKLIEIQGKSKFSGTPLADLAIKGTITMANTSSKFSKARRWKDKEGKVHRTPAKCHYRGDAEGIVSLYTVNPLFLKENVSIKGHTQFSKETSNSRCPLSGGEAIGLITGAVTKAVKNKQVAIKNHFKPSGYVDEYHANDKTHVFRTTLSPTMGAAPGNKLQFWKDVTYTNEFGDQKTTRSVVAQGLIINVTGGSEDSWVLVKKPEDAQKIRLGDKVEVVYENKKSMPGLFNALDHLTP